MINTDKYENMRLLFLEFSDSASDEVDEEAWNDKLTMLDELLAEVIRLREGIEQLYESIGTMETQGNIAIRKALKEMIE